MIDRHMKGEPVDGKYVLIVTEVVISERKQSSSSHDPYAFFDGLIDRSDL
jgi:hypothetical protein